MYKKGLFFLLLICFLPRLSPITEKELKNIVLGIKKDLLSNYNFNLNESFSNIWGTSWLIYSNKNTGEGQIGEDPVMSLFFNAKTQKVMVTIFQISHITSYDCVFSKNDYSMFMSNKDAKVTFSLSNDFLLNDEVIRWFYDSTQS